MRMLQKKYIGIVLLLLVAVSASAQKAERDYIRKGNRFFKDSVYVDAEVNYRKALEVNPKSTVSMFNLGNTLTQQNKLQEAMEQYVGATKIEKDKSNLAQIYHNMGVIFHSQKDYAKAVEAYKESLRNNPKDDETRYNLALAQKQLQDQQQNQDQNQDQDKQDQQKEQDKQQDQQKDQQQNQDQQQQPSQPEKKDNEMSKENAEQLLNSVMQDEKDVQDKVKKQQVLQYMRKIVFLCIALIAVSMNAFADGKVSFTASAPDAVAVGDQFRLSYTVTTQKVRDFRAPSMKGFDVLMGPSRSQQSSVQMINGQTTSTSSITFTYILMATAEGDFTIPGATITADGNQMVSNSVQVRVLPADQAANGASGNGGKQSEGTASRASSGTSVSNSDLFITATASKMTVYEQEAFLLTYKIYTLVDLRMFDNVKLPDFKGFHSQEVELPNDRRWGLEHYKGRNYQSTIYRQFVLFPQQAGKLTIDAARFDASIAKATQVADPFEAFFNGGSN